MRLSSVNAFGTLLLAAILSAPAWGANPALPGTLNYIEGQASIGDQTLNSKSVGSTNLETGQTLTTERGKVEVLLTPGVFLRVGDNSAATMISPNLTNTEVGLQKGTAMVEVAEIHKDNLLQVQEDGATTRLEKTGLYAFDADNGSVHVLKGEALVQDGDQNVKVKGGHELDVEQTGKLKTAKFDKNSLEQSDLYRFSSLRSEYLAEANLDAARVVVAGPMWYGAGWYWDPMFASYTWLPGDGMFWSPFGWGFYSPGWAWRAPYYGGFYGRLGYGYAGRGILYRGGFSHAPVARSTPSPHPMSGGHFGVMGGGFHGGMAAGGFRR